MVPELICPRNERIGRGEVTVHGFASGGRPAAGADHWLNGERIRIYSWLIVVVFGVTLVAWIALSLPDLVDPRGKPIGCDFMSFWSAARLALDGRAAAAFDGAAISAIQHQAVPFLPNIWFPWHYPPMFLLAVAPLGFLPYPAALALFVLGTAALWAALVRCILPDRRAWIVAAAAPAGLINLIDGQNAFLTACLAGFALLWLERRPVAAGILIGLLAVKPHLAVLFPLALVAEGRWRTIAAAAATVAVLSLAGLLAFGSDSFAIFVQHLPISQAMADRGAVPWGTMPSPYVLALSLGAPVGVARVLQGAAALGAAGCVWRVWRNPDVAFEAKAAVLVAGSLLVSPYLFYYDLTWAALAVAWLALIGLRTGFRRFEREILVFAWLAPLLMPPIYALTSLQLGCPAVLLLFGVALRRAAPLDDAERRWLGRALDAVRLARWVTRERLLRWGVGFVVMSLALLAVHVVTSTTAGLANGTGDVLANDFIHFWSGAQLAASGQAGLAYDNRWFHAFEAAVAGAGAPYGYGYPPIALLLSLPLALFSFVPGLIVWTLTGTAACVALMRRLVGWRAATLAAIGAPAAFLDLLSGQNGHFTASLFAGGLIVLDRRPVVAGICFGCLAYKPQMAVLLPIALAAGGRWRVFGAAGVTVALLGLASLAVLGSATWAGFLDLAVVHRANLEFGSSFWHRMPTVFAAARVLGAPMPMAYAAQLGSCALAVAAIVVIWRSPAPIATKAAALLVATFLATPYAWDYDAVVLIFAAAWIGREGLRTGFLPWERLAIVALLASPVVTMATTKLAGLQLGPVVLWLVLLLLVRRSLGSGFPAGAEGMSGTMPIRDIAVR
jgi:hypothetical protein